MKGSQLSYYEQETAVIQSLGVFDMYFFQELEGKNGWIALDQENCKNQHYFIVYGDSGEKLGIIGVFDTDYDKNIIHTVVVQKYRGQGLAAKFKKRLMDELNLPFITVIINIDNIASIRATEKLPGVEKVSDEKFEHDFHKVKYILSNEVKKKNDKVPKAINEELVLQIDSDSTDPDSVLKQLVVDDIPIQIVNKILQYIPSNFSISDNNVGDIEWCILIWLTETACNAVRHIGYRMNIENNISYEISISYAITNKGGIKKLQINMQDNGIGIKPEHQDIIGTREFTTSADHNSRTGELFQGGYGRFFYFFKKDYAFPRWWELGVKNRSDNKQGAVSFLEIPLIEITK